MEPLNFSRIIRRSWAMSLMLVLISGGAAAAYSITREPVYKSTAKVFVSTQSASTVGELTQGNTFTQQVVASYADIVGTPIVLQPVIDELGLNASPSQLSSRVQASVSQNTVVIDISVSDTDPVLAAGTANAISRQLSQVVETLAPAGQNGVSPLKITPVQEAAVPSTPDSPKTPLNIALGVIVGLALAVAAAILRARLDTRIRGRADVGLVTETPILGVIAKTANAVKRPLIVLDDPGSVRAEAFRSLRTNLQFLDVERTARSFVMTSSLPGEGKTTSSANLAIALADAGTSTIVIDADLRRPRLADYFGIEGGVGLTNVLIGATTLDEALQSWGEKGLTILPAGSIPPNPSELLSSAAMVSLIEELEKRFSTVIIDAPPLLPVSDAAILSRRTSGAIVIASVAKVTRPQLKASLQSIAQVGGKALGVVLTRMPLRGPDSIQYGKYGYSPKEAARINAVPLIGKVEQAIV